MITGSIVAPALLLISLWQLDLPGSDVRAAPLAFSDVSGTWDLKVETASGTATPYIVLNQEGEGITGVYKGRLGESKLEGTIKGDEISFTVTLKFQADPLTVVYKGTVDKDSMKGTAQFGDRGTGNWTAKRRQE